MAKHAIFVYGTLKRGLWNHHYLATAEFVGPAVLHDHAMVASGIPYAFVHKGGKITGELFLVDDLTLANLDRLEGHPRMYRRTPVAVELDTGRHYADAYIFARCTMAGEIIETFEGRQ